MNRLSWARINARTAFAVVLTALAPGAQAQGTNPDAPLSAIDWLSDSVTLPPPTPDPGPISSGAAVPEVLVAPLDTPVPDRFGLVDARDLGLQADLWGGSTAADLAGLVRDMPIIRLPSLRRFEIEFLLARLDPPIDAIADDSLYLARVDKLLGLAQLDAAAALIAKAGAPDPVRFRRTFDIALLQGTETQACATMEATPDISPTFPARIFCLARNGEWDVAALSLGTAEALGILSETEDQLLLHFLDAELFEDTPIPAPPAQMSPLIFRVYEAIGERPATDTLPVPFAVADLSRNVGWKTRLRAAERLASVGALPIDQLLAVFGERKAAASGGVWTRVKTLQELEAAFEARDARAISAVLPRAWEIAGDIGYDAELAAWVAPRLDGITVARAAHHTVFEIALLARNMELAEAHVTATREDATLLAIARGRVFEMELSTPLATAIRQSLSGLPPSEQYRAFLRDARAGEALLLAMETLSRGVESDPGALGDALSVLRALGLSELARQCAVELLIEDSRV